MKYLAVETTQTESMYGFPVLLFDLSEENLKELKRLKGLFEQVKEIDKEISEVVYYASGNLSFELANDYVNGCEKELEVVELSSDEFQSFTNEYDTDYRVESPSIRVDESYVYIVYNSKWTSDEVYCSINFYDFEELLQKDLQGL